MSYLGERFKKVRVLLIAVVQNHLLVQILLGSNEVLSTISTVRTNQFNEFKKSLHSVAITSEPTTFPSNQPTISIVPTCGPSSIPTFVPTSIPSIKPSSFPSHEPTVHPTAEPTINPSCAPSLAPSIAPSFRPTNTPSASPSTVPTPTPSHIPTITPSSKPSAIPTLSPSAPDFMASITSKNTTIGLVASFACFVFLTFLCLGCYFWNYQNNEKQAINKIEYHDADSNLFDTFGNSKSDIESASVTSSSSSKLKTPDVSPSSKSKSLQFAFLSNKTENSSNKSKSAAVKPLNSTTAEINSNSALALASDGSTSTQVPLSNKKESAKAHGEVESGNAAFDFAKFIKETGMLLSPPKQTNVQYKKERDRQTDSILKFVKQSINWTPLGTPDADKMKATSPSNVNFLPFTEKEFANQANKSLSSITVGDNVGQTGEIGEIVSKSKCDEVDDKNSNSTIKRTITINGSDKRVLKARSQSDEKSIHDNWNVVEPSNTNRNAGNIISSNHANTKIKTGDKPNQIINRFSVDSDKYSKMSSIDDARRSEESFSFSQTRLSEIYNRNSQFETTKNPNGTSADTTIVYNKSNKRESNQLDETGRDSDQSRVSSSSELADIYENASAWRASTALNGVNPTGSPKGISPNLSPYGSCRGSGSASSRGSGCSSIPTTTRHGDVAAPPSSTNLNESPRFGVALLNTMESLITGAKK